MAAASQHTFQILTKRHERLASIAGQLDWPENVWMGVSIENRRFVHRADYLREVPAAVRFISAEPLLGPLEGLKLIGIDWLIAGGEFGPRHRRTCPRPSWRWTGPAAPPARRRTPSRSAYPSSSAVSPGGAADDHDPVVGEHPVAALQ